MIRPRTLRFLVFVLPVLFALRSAPLVAQNEGSPIVERAAIPGNIDDVLYDERNGRMLLDGGTTTGDTTGAYILDTNVRTLWWLDRGRIGGRSIKFPGFGPDGGLFIVTAIDKDNDHRDRGLEVHRFGPTGALQWKRTYDFLGEDVVVFGAVDRSGNLLLLYHRDYLADTTERIVMKISAGGTLLWQRTIQLEAWSGATAIRTDRHDRVHILSARTRNRRWPWIEHRQFGADGTARAFTVEKIPDRYAYYITRGHCDDAGNLYVNVRSERKEPHRNFLLKLGVDGRVAWSREAPSQANLKFLLVADPDGNLWALGVEFAEVDLATVRTLMKIDTAGALVHEIGPENAKILEELADLDVFDLTMLRSGEVQIAAVRNRDVVVARFDSAGRSTLSRVTTLLRPDDQHRKLSALRTTSGGTIVFIANVTKPFSDTILTEFLKFQP